MVLSQELLISIDKSLPSPLSRQISEQIQNYIIRGFLRRGESIPPTRLLAEQLQVSRTVVLEAYEQLQAEGYVEMRRGAGTFIADLAAGINTDEDIIDTDKHAAVFTRAPSVLSIGNPSASGLVEITNTVPYDFRHGVPAWDAFPMDKWQKALMHSCRKATPETLTYGPAEGSLALREEIARLVRSTRCIPAVPEQIVITAGATQTLDILSRLCLQEGEQVVVEDPAHTVLREIFSFSGGTVIPVPVDQEGLCVDRIEQSIARHRKNSAGKTKLLYVTPSHQFPMGVTLSLNRRIEVLNWARNNGALVIEDDYDSEYRYVGQKMSALAGLDSGGIVVYVGSFSKVLFPALRIGYAILPLSLVKPFLAVKWITDRMSPTLEQEALAEFIRSGQYAKHVNQMGKLYSVRRACLVSALNEEFGKRVCYFGDEAGLHLLIQLDTAADEETIAGIAIQYGTKIYPASQYFSDHKPNRATFLLGYSNLSETQIRKGIRQMARAEAEVTREKRV